MATYLGILLFAFLLTGILTIPFIDLLYRLNLTNKSKSAVNKFGTPTGAGVLLVILITCFYSVIVPLAHAYGLPFTSIFSAKSEYHIIFFALISFALLGLFEDLVKVFKLPAQKLWIKHPAQILLAFITAILIYNNLHISHIYIPLIGAVQMGVWYVAVATGVIYLFARGVDITDGLDGLSSGVLVIALSSFWILALSALDTYIGIFIALWIGSLLAFLYFNVYPARVWLGNSGSLSFGATLAVIGLILGKVVPLFLIGGIFMVEACANLLQFASLRYRHKKLFPISPPHYWLESLGWHEAKVTLRAWLISALLALAGLWLASFA